MREKTWVRLVVVVTLAAWVLAVAGIIPDPHHARSAAASPAAPPPATAGPSASSASPGWAAAGSANAV